MSSTARLEGLENKINYFNVEEDLTKSFKSQEEFDIIIHLAANQGRNNEKEEEVYSVNFDFSKSLLDLALAYNVPSFINADTGLSSGLNAYTSSKKKFKGYAKKHMRNSNMKFINLEIENFFGPNEPAEKFTSQVFSSCLKGLDSIDLSL